VLIALPNTINRSVIFFFFHAFSTIFLFLYFFSRIHWCFNATSIINIYTIIIESQAKGWEKKRAASVMINRQLVTKVRVRVRVAIAQSI
jgi:ABC-type multidrug transport system permease subunit